MKLGIIVDSSCGLSEKEANKRGWGFLPLFLYINNKEYADGVDLEAKEYYNKIKLEDTVRTSATPISKSLELFGEFSKLYDHVIVYGLSSPLSSQTNSLKLVAKEKNNVIVVDSRSVGYSIVKDCEEFEEMAKNGITIDEIKADIDKKNNSHFGFAIPQTLDWLVKGGRISNKIAAMAKLIKIVPIIAFEDGKLEKHGKGRVFRKTIIKLAQKIKNKYPDDEVLIYHGMNKDIVSIQKEIEEIFQKKVPAFLFPPVIVNHIGLGVIAFFIRKK